METLRIILAVLSVVALLGLSACGTTEWVHQDRAGMTTAQKAQSAIDEANVAVTASARTIAAHRKDKLITTGDAKAWETRLTRYAADVDQAQALLDAGQDGAALTKAGAMKTLIRELQKEVARQAAVEEAKRKEQGK